MTPGLAGGPGPPCGSLRDNLPRPGQRRAAGGARRAELVGSRLPQGLPSRRPSHIGTGKPPEERGDLATLPRMRPRHLALPLLCLLLVDAPAGGQPASPAPQQGQMLLTVFLRHDQSKTLAEIRAELEKNGADLREGLRL